MRTTFVSPMSHQGVAIEEIARLAGHATTRTTEIVYRRELRPVITTGAEIRDQRPWLAGAVVIPEGAGRGPGPVAERDQIIGVTDGRIADSV
jgi:hypothetical protein